jgi:hypothetical protein
MQPKSFSVVSNWHFYARKHSGLRIFVPEQTAQSVISVSQEI